MPTKKKMELMGFILFSLVCPWLGNEVYAKMGSHITTKEAVDFCSLQLASVGEHFHLNF
jgi:hypothetical protein